MNKIILLYRENPTADRRIADVPIGHWASRQAISIG